MVVENESIAGTVVCVCANVCSCNNESVRISLHTWVWQVGERFNRAREV